MWSVLCQQLSLDLFLGTQFRLGATGSYFFTCSVLPLFLAGCSLDNEMCCVMFYNKLFIYAPFSLHILYQQVSAVIHITVRYDQRVANLFKSAIAENHAILVSGDHE